MASLYENGWRQGSIVAASFEVSTIGILGEAFVVEALHYAEWAVVSQDCELDWTDTNDTKPTIELRPVFTDDPPQDWGIRSARFLLTDDPARYLDSSSPRLNVSPAALGLCSDARKELLDANRRLALKKWLGLRYDRPAVPPELVELARAIAESVRTHRSDPIAPRLRDIVMQFDDTASPPRFSLYAITLSESDTAEARQWLAKVALAIPTSLGIGDELEAAPASGISLELIETSYAADVTQITWGRRNPRGAE